MPLLYSFIGWLEHAVKKVDIFATRAPSSGFTLIELMIAVAILAVIASVALPAYQDYIATSREGVLVTNISTMEMFQEDFRLRNGGYLTSAADNAAIEAGIGWAPQSDDGTTYVITDAGGGSYDVTATAPDGTALCLRMPAKDRCP